MTDDIQFTIPASEPAVEKKSSRGKENLLDKEGSPTVLDELAEELAKEIERPEIEITLPARPSVSLTFSPNITQYELRRWRRQSGEKKGGELDTLKFACQIVGHTCTGIKLNGELATDSEGNPITFGSPVVMKMTKTEVPIPDAIRAFFAVDPHIESAALAILEAAGYGEEVIQEENPTKTALNNL